MKPLWDFQEKAVERLRGHLREGKTNLLLCAPTGSGKTLCSVHFLSECAAKQKRAVFVADRVNLVNQTSAVLDGEGLEHGVLMASHWRHRPWSRIQVASAQTIEKRNWPEADLLVIDEAHAMRKAVLERIQKRDVPVIGLSATPFTKGLGKYYDAVVQAETTDSLIRQGFLAPYLAYAPSAPDMTGAKTVAGEWTDDVAEERAMPIVGDCVAEYLKLGGGKKAICFACTVAHSEELQRQFMAAGVRAELYTYRTGDEQRTRILEEYRKPDSQIRVLISVAALARGFDVPDVHVGIMARPLRKSFMEWIQMFGRVLRRDPDDANKTALILDHSGNYERFYPEMREFFSNGIAELDDGKPDKKAKSKTKEQKPARCPKCTHVHAKAPACPMCGFVYPRERIVHQAGTLVEAQGGAQGLAAKVAFHAELLWIARERGYKSGWAAHAYKEKFGVWPRGMGLMMHPPSGSTLKWLRYRQIRRAKGAAKAKAGP